MDKVHERLKKYLGQSGRGRVVCTPVSVTGERYEQLAHEPQKLYDAAFCDGVRFALSALQAGFDFRHVARAVGELESDDGQAG